MESVVIEDSPVAQYLEGEEGHSSRVASLIAKSIIGHGEAGDHEWTQTSSEPVSPAVSFAPRGLPARYVYSKCLMSSPFVKGRHQTWFWE